MPANMDLWIEGAWGTESIAFQQPIPFDMERFVTDDVYAHRISTHVSTVLGYLAEELAEIGLMATPADPDPSIDDPSTFRCVAQKEGPY